MKLRLLTLILFLSILTFSLSATAADNGRIDMAPLAAAMSASPKVNINFGPAMIAGFAETLRQSNPEFADVLGSVSGLRLMVFENVDAGAAESNIAGIISQLSAAGWTSALAIQDDSTLVDIYLKESAEFVDGLVLLLRDGPNTAVFANIHGRLDPVTIGRMIGSGKAMSDLNLGGLISQFQGGDGAAKKRGE